MSPVPSSCQLPAELPRVSRRSSWNSTLVSDQMSISQSMDPSTFSVDTGSSRQLTSAGTETGDSDVLSV